RAAAPHGALRRAPACRPARGGGRRLGAPLPPRPAWLRLRMDADPRQPSPAQRGPWLRHLRPRRLAGPAADHRRHRRAPDHRHPWQYRRPGPPPVRTGRGRRVLPLRGWRRVAAGRRTGRRGTGAGRMRRFAALYRELDRSTATGDKRAALVAYFRDAPPADAAWALHLLSGGK